MYRHLRGVDCENGGGDFDEATRGLGGNSGERAALAGAQRLSRSRAQHRRPGRVAHLLQAIP